MAPLAKLRLAALLVAGPLLVFGFSVTPQSVVLDLPGGARKQLEFTVVNEDPARAATLRYFAAPFVQKENGAYRITDQPDSQFSSAGWFDVETTLVTIPANSGKLVTITVVVPPGTTGSHFGAIVFDKLPETSTQGPGSAAVGMVTRTPAFVEITSTGRMFRPKASLTGLKVVPAAELQRHFGGKARADALGVSASIRNDGQVSFPNSGRIVIRDSQGKRVKTYPLGTGKVLPGATVAMVSIIPPLRPGSYTAEVAVQAGTAVPLRGAAPFTIGGGGRPASGTLAAAPALEVSANKDNIELEAPPGATRSTYVVLRNEGTTSIPFNVSLAGLRSSREGVLEQTDTVVGSVDCRPWLAVEPQSFTLDSGATLPVKVTATIPATMPGGKYADIVFEQTAAPGSNQPAPSLLVPVLLTVRGEYARRAEIVALATPNPAAELSLAVANTGEVHLNPKARVVIHRAKVAVPMTEMDYDRVGIFTLNDDAVVLPGDTVILTGRFDGTVPKGAYRLNATVDCGGGLAITTSKQLLVK